MCLNSRLSAVTKHLVSTEEEISQGCLAGIDLCLIGLDSIWPITFYLVNYSALCNITWWQNQKTSQVHFMFLQQYLNITYKAKKQRSLPCVEIYFTLFSVFAKLQTNLKTGCELLWDSCASLFRGVTVSLLMLESWNGPFYPAG